MIRANLHTHTVFCDGVSTVEEIVRAAERLGFTALGFSGHSFLALDEPRYWMTPEDTLRYREEVTSAKSKAKTTEIYLGIERDIESPDDGFAYDFVIGSVHHLLKDGRSFAVDDTPEIFEAAVRTFYGGDVLALCRDYYARVSDVVGVTGCDVVGHFDLVTKFNENGGYFDEDSPTYRRYALDALDALTGKAPFFEVNTGAIARGYRTLPYPAPFLMRALIEKGARLVLGSDCHKASMLDFGFSLAEDYIRSFGFTSVWTLCGGSWTELPL